MSKKDRETAKYECYVNMQRQDGSTSRGLIIFGNGDTCEEAKELFDHAMAEYLEKLKED